MTRTADQESRYGDGKHWCLRRPAYDQHDLQRPGSPSHLKPHDAPFHRHLSYDSDDDNDFRDRQLETINSYKAYDATDDVYHRNDDFINTAADSKSDCTEHEDALVKIENCVYEEAVQFADEVAPSESCAEIQNVLTDINIVRENLSISSVIDTEKCDTFATIKEKDEVESKEDKQACSEHENSDGSQTDAREEAHETGATDSFKDTKSDERSGENPLIICADNRLDDGNDDTDGRLDTERRIDTGSSDENETRLSCGERVILKEHEGLRVPENVTTFQEEVDFQDLSSHGQEDHEEKQVKETLTIDFDDRLHDEFDNRVSEEGDHSSQSLKDLSKNADIHENAIEEVDDSSEAKTEEPCNIDGIQEDKRISVKSSLWSNVESSTNSCLKLSISLCKVCLEKEVHIVNPCCKHTTGSNAAIIESIALQELHSMFPQKHKDEDNYLKPDFVDNSHGRQNQDKIPLSYTCLKQKQPPSRAAILDNFYRQYANSRYLKVDKVMRTNIAFPLSRQHPSEVQGIPWDSFERQSMREASFLFYPESAPKSKELLAAAGFVYIGDGDDDKIICYFCFLVKENWRADEDIEEVHRSSSPHCPMVVVVSSNNISATTVTTVSESDRTGPAAPSGAARDAGAGPAVTYIASRSPASSSGLDHPGKGHQDQGQQNRFRPRPSPISPTAIYESQHPLARGPLGSQSQPTATRTPSTGASSSTSQNSQANEDSHQQGNHPVINSQIYAIPANPPTTTSHQGGEESTTSNPETSSGRDTADSAGEVAPPRQLNYRDLGIFHERPKHPQFAVLVVRLQSYADWPRDHPLKPDDLAKSGLYFAGYADCCKCFFCGGGLRRWDPEDNAFVEHARWFPRCGYIRQYMGEHFVEAVGELKPKGGTITMQQVRDYMAQKNMAVSNEFEDLPIAEDAAVKSLLDEGYNKERVCSVAKELRDSGVPLSADIILEKLNNLNVTDVSTSVGAMAQAAREAGRRKDDSIQQLKDQNYTLRSNLTCKICMDKEVKVVFLPCGHLVACQECAVALQDCPVCRRHIRATVRASIR